MAENDPAGFDRNGCFYLVAIVALILVFSVGGMVLSLGGGSSYPYDEEEIVWDYQLFPGDEDLSDVSPEFINFDELGTPTIRTPLSDPGTTRLREVVVKFGPGEDGVNVAVANDGERVSRGGQGVAARTEDLAILIDNRRFLTLERPDDCVGGCIYSFWITMGSSFQANHPNAELVVYAGEGSEGRADEVETLWSEIYR